MNRTKLLVVSIVLAALLLSACGSVGYSLRSAVPAGAANEPAQAPAAVTQPDLAGVAGLQSAYEAVYTAVNPSVVTIEIGTRQASAGPSGGFSFGGPGSGQKSQIVPTAEGSGVIWDSAGHIVTNNHVVAGAAKITVTFTNGASYAANVVGTDPNTDLAVVQVTGAPASLIKPITVGDSSRVKVGEMAIAIGNPFGLANTMTTGIVSAIGRSIDSGAGASQGTSGGYSIPDVIQTDAAINPGNSGGALVDMSGALIGIPSQIESQSGSNSGIGFAIPSGLAKQVAGQLISKGAASHSYLGISGTSVTADVVAALNLKAGQTGVLVADVMKGGPADKAGLKPAPVDANGTPTAAGDIIVGINGKPTNTFEDLVSYLYANTQPGQVVTLDVVRGGQQVQIQVTLGTQPTH